ncbi:sel1 repeat family protein [Campylobacter sputorum]|uniref:sel1 repeat family protein n=1 Tax=Campylobacter sputorum TaxID=206 RepID=UPI00068FEB6F|nr:sel1 repeat family protein [Campylobacter sputorum]
MRKIILFFSLILSLLVASDLDKYVEFWRNGDYKKATKYLKLGCDGGDAMSCGFLGALYAKGKGVKQSYYEAKRYFGMACDLEDKTGCGDYAKLNKAGY